MSDRDAAKYFHGRTEELQKSADGMKEATGTDGGTVFLNPGAFRSGKTALFAECRHIAETKQWQTARIKSRALWHKNILLQRTAIARFLTLIPETTDFAWKDLVETLTVHLRNGDKAKAVVQTALRIGILDMRKGVSLFRSHPYITGFRRVRPWPRDFPMTAGDSIPVGSGTGLPRYLTAPEALMPPVHQSSKQVQRGKSDLSGTPTASPRKVPLRPLNASSKGKGLKKPDIQGTEKRITRCFLLT